MQTGVEMAAAEREAAAASREGSSNEGGTVAAVALLTQFISVLSLLSVF